MSIKVIGFDFDGVIVDTSGVKSQCFLDLFRGNPHFAEIKGYEDRNQARPRSEKISEVLLDILHKKDLSELDPYLDQYRELITKKITKAEIIPGVREFLVEIKKLEIPSYIVSSAPIEEIQYLLSHHKLEKHFCRIFDFRTPKVQAINSIVREHKIEPQKMIFFGDHLSDLRASKEAGCQFAAINPAVEFPKDTRQFKNFTSFDWQLLR